MSSNLECRSLLHGFDKGGLFDLGHPLLNRISESFVKAAGVYIMIHIFLSSFHYNYDLNFCIFIFIIRLVLFKLLLVRLILLLLKVSLFYTLFERSISNY